MSDIFILFILALLLVLKNAIAYQDDFEFTGIQVKEWYFSKFLPYKEIREKFRIVPSVDGNRVEKFNLNIHAYENIGVNARPRILGPKIYGVEYTGNDGESEKKILRKIECNDENCSFKQVLRMTLSRKLAVNLALGGNFHEYEGLSQEMNGISVYDHETLEVGFERALDLGNVFTVYFGGEVVEGNQVTFKDLGIETDARFTLIFASIKEALDSIKEEGCKIEKITESRKWHLASYDPERCLEWFGKAMNIIKKDRFDVLHLGCK